MSDDDDDGGSGGWYRRGVLRATGTLAAAAAIGDPTAAAQPASYVVEQGSMCVPLRPVQGTRTVEQFYEYQLPSRYVSEENGAVVGGEQQYNSAGTRDLQRADTSILFLYDGPRGVSLVVVHGGPSSPNGGSVTFTFSGLPTDGRWVINDDLYNGPSNYDQWEVEGEPQRINWTWAAGRTDGGAFHPISTEADVTLNPAFNQAADLFGIHYDGAVTDWELLSATETGVERVALALDEPIRIRSGSCGSAGTTVGGDDDGEDDSTESDATNDSEDGDDEATNQASNPTDDAEPPDDEGPPEDAGPPDNAGPPDHSNAPDNAGPPDGAGPPDDAGPPGSDAEDDQDSDGDEDDDEDDKPGDDDREREENGDGEEEEDDADDDN